MMPVFMLITAAGLLGLGYAAGAVQPIFAGDSTGIVWGVASLGLLGTGMSRARRSWLVWMVEHQVCTLLGLLGTVLGIWQAMQGMDGMPGPEQLSGAFVALSTTAVGLMTHLWLLLVREVTR